MPGIYIHVPFCDGKCPYCDFYSLRGDGELMDRYVSALSREIGAWADSHDRQAAGTVYFGGGTPNLLGAERLSALLERVRDCFAVQDGAEITLEANPTGGDRAFFQAVRKAGFNRLSMGLQSANEEELAFLGRRHTSGDVKRSVEAARGAGFDNISLDLMLGLPGGTKARLEHSIDFAAGLGVEHISAYILKVEEGTPFAARGVQVPEDDDTADQYLFCVEELERRGYAQYEISNFARPGRESRHNLVYWHGEEYLGFGPGAHSFYGGKRFYYDRDLAGFLAGAKPAADGEGGGFAEYAMLNLRLTEGLRRDRCRERYGPAGEAAFDRMAQRVKKCPPGLVRTDNTHIWFSPEGFLVSNGLILKLLEE